MESLLILQVIDNVEQDKVFIDLFFSHWGVTSFPYT